jgi:zinc protease
VYEKDSLFAQVSEAGTMLLSGFKVDDADRILDGVRAVTAADVKRVAGRYFDPDVLTVATLDPQPAASRTAGRSTGVRRPGGAQ